MDRISKLCIIATVYRKNASNKHSVYIQPMDKAEVKEAPKTNKSNSSAYDGTVEFDLCSKSKCLAKQAFCDIYEYCPLIRQKSQIFDTFPQGEGFLFAF